MPAPFHFLSAFLQPESDFRWVLLDGLPTHRTEDLGQFVRQSWGKTHWTLISYLDTNEFEWESDLSQPALVLVDALHEKDKTRLLPAIKKALLKMPTRKFVFLTSETVSAAEIPSYLGPGKSFHWDS